MAEYPENFVRKYNVQSDNISSHHKRDKNKVRRHDMFIVKKQITETESFRCEGPQSDFQSINAKSDKMRAMDDVWKHDMFEITEREIAESKPRENLKPVELYLSNLNERVSESDILDLFSVIGRLRKLSMHYDTSGRPLGTAIVFFDRKVDAIEAIKKYNGEPLDGKPLKIELLSNSSNERSSRYGRSIRHYNRDRDDRVLLSGIHKHDTSTQETLSHCKDFENLTGYFNNMNMN